MIRAHYPLSISEFDKLHGEARCPTGVKHRHWRHAEAQQGWLSQNEMRAPHSSPHVHEVGEEETFIELTLGGVDRSSGSLNILCKYEYEAACVTWNEERNSLLPIIRSSIKPSWAKSVYESSLARALWVHKEAAHMEQRISIRTLLCSTSLVSDCSTRQKHVVVTTRHGHRNTGNTYQIIEL